PPRDDGYRSRCPPAAPSSCDLPGGKAHQTLRDELACVPEILERRDLEIAPLARHHLHREPRCDDRGRVVAERPIAGRGTRLLEQAAAEDLGGLRGPEALPLDLLARRAGLVGATDRAGQWQTRDARAVASRARAAAFQAGPGA